MAWQMEAFDEEDEEEDDNDDKRVRGMNKKHKMCNNTTQQICCLYRKLVELFGDGVVMGLSKWGENQFERPEKEVKLTNKDSFKTGEQLIEEMMMEGVGEGVVRRDRGSQDREMSVKTTFSDAHIKLTIAKKILKDDITDQEKPKKPSSIHSPKSHKGSITELFDRVPLKLTDEALISFKFKGRNLLSTFTEKRKAMLLARNMAKQHASVSRYRLLCASLPLHGKRPTRLNSLRALSKI